MIEENKLKDNTNLKELAKETLLNDEFTDEDFERLEEVNEEYVLTEYDEEMVDNFLSSEEEVW